MADPRIISGAQVPSTGPTTRPRLTPERSEAARAAQRAFFEAAMSKTAEPRAAQASQAASATAETASAGASQSVQLARTSLRIDNVTPPTRLLRPGSLLDITI